jgi:hypothetical protein
MTHSISIDLSIYESQLRAEIASDLTTLQFAIEGIKQPDYLAKKYILKQGITISEINVPPNDFLERREINKSLKSIMGSVQDYMDKMIAVLRFKNEEIFLKPTMTQQEINIFLTQKFEKHLLDVSVDRSLVVPTKMSLLLDKPEHEVFKNALQSYFDLRNGLEHHKGIAKTERIIRYKRMGMASTAGYEIIEIGKPLGENEGMVLKSFDEEIKFDKGGVMLLTRNQLDSIVLNLLIFVMPTIQISVAEKFGMSPNS